MKMNISPNVFLQMVRDGLKPFNDKRMKPKYEGWLQDTINVFNSYPELKSSNEYKQVLKHIRDKKINDII